MQVSFVLEDAGVLPARLKAWDEGLSKYGLKPTGCNYFNPTGQES
jgi:hypothetical protein